MTVYSIVYLITEVFYMYVLYLLFEVFFDKRRTSKILYFTTYIAFGLVADSAYLISGNVVLNAVLNIFFMFLISMHFEASYKRRIMMVFLMYIMIAAIETIVVILTATIDISPIRKNEYQHILGPIIFKIILYVIALLLRNYKKVKEDMTVPTSLWVLVFLIPSGSIYLILNIIDKLYLHKTRMILCISIILLIDFVTFYLYDTVTQYYSEKIKTELLQQENIYYSQQFENIKTHIDEVNAFRHDIRNHLKVLDSLLDSRGDAARNYISGLTGALAAGNQYSRTGNIPIDSIINYKLMKARENQVDIQINISIPKELASEPADMVAILGNLLDNAINASLKLEEGRKIDFCMTYERGVLQIDIANTYNGIVRYENERIKTTSGNERYHGYGLRNVENALKKYHGYYKVAHDEHTFRVIALMYV